MPMIKLSAEASYEANLVSNFTFGATDEGLVTFTLSELDTFKVSELIAIAENLGLNFHQES